MSNDPGVSTPAGGGTWRAVFAEAQRARRWPGAVLLVVVADLLFWQREVGLSLALFATATFAVATADARPMRALVGPAALLACGALPVLEFAQPLSVAFLIAALIGALAWARLPEALAAERLVAGAAILRGLPGAWLGAVALPLRAGRSALSPDNAAAGATVLRRFLRDWAVPLGGVCIFAALLLQANPVLERLLTPRLDLVELARRGLFWAGIALLCWPLLDPDPRRHGLPRPVPSRPVPGINAASVLRALVLFNLLIGVQTVMDLAILTGGAALPEGMNYAAYAHRGAYPLLATVLLAGAFALAARPFLAEHRVLKPLTLLWLGQNVMLSLSALLRLELYIEAYGLTYLRVHALIWMALVATGLALTGWQVARGRSNRWLLARTAALGLATLYLACFVNFAAIIAAKNLTLPRPDLAYIHELGPTAAAAVADAVARNPELAGAVRREAMLRHRPLLVPPRIVGWRDWGFRNWRVARYLARTTASAGPDEDPDRR